MLTNLCKWWLERKGYVICISSKAEVINEKPGWLRCLRDAIGIKTIDKEKTEKIKRILEA